MFPKGSRFPTTKFSEVPGPNSYNVQDPEYDAYKRGAFLEKADRFNKDNPSEDPGHSNYKTDSKTTNTKPKATMGSKPQSGDRLTILQRKVEELEGLHTESKKSHHGEVERLKLELSRMQTLNAEQNERIEKLKKQNGILETRMQEWKKASAAEQAELKELRAKLRVSEHERAQLSAKQGDVSETKKALQALDSKRREELRERDRKIAELEKTAAAEKKRWQSADAKIQEAKSKGDGMVEQVRSQMDDMTAELQTTRAEALEAKTLLAVLQAQSADTEEELVAQLEHHKDILTRVAGQYGRLASSTVSAATHDRVKRECAVMRMRVFRLERKMADCEGQVVELVNLARNTKETNAFLSARLRDAEEEVAYFARSLKEAYLTDREDLLVDCAIDGELLEVADAIHASEITLQETLAKDARIWQGFHRLRNEEMLFHGSVLAKAMDAAQDKIQKQTTQLAETEGQNIRLITDLEKAHATEADATNKLSEVFASLAQSKSTADALRTQLDVTRAESKAEVSKAAQALRNEKEAMQRLAKTLQKSKAAEENLRAEVEQLAAELTQAERFEEAYNALSEEVGALVARESLAEEEAEHLRKFNAEILGHNNPAQRIMYVDRIRRELYETKQKLLACTHDREAALADNEDLQHELELYKSVVVPLDNKPRTTVTRVGRLPLVERNANAHTKPPTLDDGQALTSVPETEYDHGNMTLDELSQQMSS